ncbi:MAG: sigma-54 dependent transcriptional regulator [Terriglobia bacterium]
MSTQLSSPLFSSAIIASSNDNFRRKLLDSLRSARCSVQEARGGAEALAQLEEGCYQALLLDNWLPDLDVNEILSIVKKRHPQVKVLVMDPGSDERGQEEEMRSAMSAEETFQTSASSPEIPADQDLPSGASENPCELTVEPLPGMIGVSQAMQNLYKVSRLVAQHSTTVLLTGETGTGKELVAKAIHLLSPRHKQPFITVNCAAIPETLLEAELFGYARGAFTGAFQSRMGRIHAAHGGTLFLDEVGDLPLSMQAKLLRFLQEGEVQRLGGPDVIRVDVRVIAATNAELAKRVSEKAFREDLFYRLSVFPIDLVPLRDHPEDILPLSSSFLNAFCREGNLPSKVISREAGKLLGKHPWPGNVRELQHVIERAFILSEQYLEILPKYISLQTPWQQA